MPSLTMRVLPSLHTISNMGSKPRNVYLPQCCLSSALSSMKQCLSFSMRALRTSIGVLTSDSIWRETGIAPNPWADSSSAYSFVGLYIYVASCIL